MIIHLDINNKFHEIDVSLHDSLFHVLRKLGYYGVKNGGEKGETGIDVVLFDGKPINAKTILCLQAVGHQLETIENIGEHPNKGWKKTPGLHSLQQSFIETGAIQCGYCTPAQILAAKELLSREPDPSEEEIRDAISGVLCRCTGYLKPVMAVKRAAAILRGEYVPPIDITNSTLTLSGNESPTPLEYSSDSNQGLAGIMPNSKVIHTEPMKSTVGMPRIKVDAVKLAQGHPAFTADDVPENVLFAKVLRSPHAHARIKEINVDKALEIPGVVSILTHKDIPRVVYSTAGQSDPIPGPLDCFSLDSKVRHVGDRVAFVAAKSEEIADNALDAIKVEYDLLKPILDPNEAMIDDAPIIHDEAEYQDFAESDAKKNLAARIRIDIGNVDNGFDEADLVFEGEYAVSKVQQAHLEPHVALSYWDENDRLVIKTSTQVPFHVRRQLAPLIDLPIKRIRVIKPRIGGGFGNKQEFLIEDIIAHLTIATGRPVIYEYTREEEFIASRSRHPMRIHMKTGVKKDGTITANQMIALSDTGANGAHALTVTGNTGHKSMALYVGDGEYRQKPNIRFYADVVYTNHPPSGAYRGYGVPQGFWAIERHMEKIANELEINPIDFRLKNSLREGELQPFSTAWSEGREPQPETIETCGLVECVRQGKSSIEWDMKFGNDDWRNVPGKSHLRRGIGLALVMQGTAIPYLDMGGAMIKMNDDGSFNLMVGATDLGTGSDTVLGQMAAEILGVPLEDLLVYSSDTDFTPFDKGAYASSTTYISGWAVTIAAYKVAEQIMERAALMLDESGNGMVDPTAIVLSNRKATAPDGRSVTHCQIGLHSFHHSNQKQIMGTGSYNSPVAPPPFGAQFAEVTVDIETGQVVVDRLVMAVDSGRIINPITASGQIEGGMTQALGYALCEEMIYDEHGKPRESDLIDYHILRAHEMPELETVFVETHEPTHPFGVKAVAEIPMDGVAPAVGNAVFNACGVNIDSLPITPEKVWRELDAHQ